MDAALVLLAVSGAVATYLMYGRALVRQWRTGDDYIYATTACASWTAMVAVGVPLMLLAS